MTLMLTLGTATFGAQKTLPSGKDTGSINVTNLKPGDTVTAYQFVKANLEELKLRKLLILKGVGGFFLQEK